MLRLRGDVHSNTSAHRVVVYGKNFAVIAMPGVAPKLDNIPADYESRLIPLDFNKMADARDRVLTEWTRRYDAKSEAKK